MLINRTLDSRYTILELVGGGGMADVYRAHDKLLDRSVAVKVLRSQFTGDEEFVTRFRREAQAAARLSHPNIVNIYDVGYDEDVHYIVMEYISGETLKDLIIREKDIAVETAVRIALEIAEALEHAHHNGLIHCDIKPHNILMSRTGRIKVTDFGIARAVTSATMTQTGTIIGSVHYFSPEQAKGSAVGAKSDIYSLGVVIYEMLTGVVPFQGETPISIALKHLQEDPKPPREYKPDLPPLLEAIVLKAMAKEPDRRFTDISEMIADLRLAASYLRDEQTRRLSRHDFPTQVLNMPLPENIDSATSNKRGSIVKSPVSEKKLMTGRWAWLLITFLFLGSAGIAFLLFGKFWSMNDVIVPNLVGKNIDTARSTLIEKNLRISVTESFHERIAPGLVISQNPEAGATVKEQRAITVVVSKGGEMTAVPDLRGLNRRDAELQIKNAGLVLGRIDEQYTTASPADTVLSQFPRPPSQVIKGTAIDLAISKGPEPPKITLPDFRGSPLATVASQLESLKLKQGKITEAPSDKYPTGTISDQNPPPAAEVAPGTTIDFTVAKAAAVKRAVVQITVPEGSPRQTLQIVLTDATGRRVVYNNIHKPGDKVERTVEGSGTVRVQVYLNNTLLQEQTI